MKKKNPLKIEFTSYWVYRGGDHVDSETQIMLYSDAGNLSSHREFNISLRLCRTTRDDR